MKSKILKNFCTFLLVLCFLVESITPAFAADNTLIGSLETEDGSSLSEEEELTGVFNFENLEYEISEGDKSLRVKVVRKGGLKKQSFIDVHILDVTTTRNEDYTISIESVEHTEEELGDLKQISLEDTTLIGRLYFAEGEEKKEFKINLIDDELSEGTEMFMMSLQNPVGEEQLGKDSSSVVNISDNEPEEFSTVEFSEPQWTVDGDSSYVSLDIVKKGAEYKTVTVDYSSEDDIFSEHVKGTVVFMPGETKKTVEILLDNLDIGTKSLGFTVNLENCKGGNLGKYSEAQVKILPIQTNVIELSKSEMTVGPGNDVIADATSGSAITTGTAINTEKGIVYIPIIAKELNQAVTVYYSTEDKTAKAGINYDCVKGELSFEPGEKEKKVEIPVYFNSDSLRAPAEESGPKPFLGKIATVEKEDELSFDFILTGIEGGKIGTIDKTSVTLISGQKSNKGLTAVGFQDNIYYTEQGMNTVSVNIERKGLTDVTTKVMVKTSEKTALADIDYKPVSEQVTFGPGETENEIIIPIIDTNSTEEKSFYISLEYIDGGILDNKRAEVVISPADMMMMASISGEIDDMQYSIPLDKSGWENGVKGKYTTINIGGNNIKVSISDKGWGIDKNYDTSVVTKDYYDLTGYGSLVVDWESTTNNGQITKFVITDNSQGDRNESVDDQQRTYHKGSFSRTTDEMNINLTGPYFFRFNAYNTKDKKSTSTLHGLTLKKRIYELNPVFTEHGSIDYSITEGYLGREIQITAKPNIGYQFDGYKVGNLEDIIPAEGRNIAKLVITQDLLKKSGINNGDFIITPVFSEVIVPVQIIQTEGGSVVYNDNQVDGTTLDSICYNNTIQLKAVPDEGKIFAGWEISGQDGIYNNNPLNLTLQDENYVITPHFTGNYKVQLNNDNSNLGNAYTDKVNYKQGEVAVLQAEPNIGYWAQWKIDDNIYQGNTFYVLMDDNKSVTVDFVPKSYSDTYYSTNVTGKVTDEKGNGLSGVKVYLQGKESITDKYGCYSFSNVVKNEGPEIIAVDDYFNSGRTCVKEENLEDYFKTVTFRIFRKKYEKEVLQLPDIIPDIQSEKLSMKVQKVESIYSFSGDVNDNPIELEDNNIIFNITTAWNGAQAGHVFLQVRGENGEIKKKIEASINSNDKNLAAFNIDVDDTFSVGDRLEAFAEDMEGNKSEVIDAKIKVINPVPDVEFNEIMDMDTPMDIPGGMPYFSGSPEFGVGNMSFSVESEDGAFVLYAGVAKTLRENGEKAESPDNILGYFMKAPSYDDIVEGVDKYDKILKAKAGSIEPGIQTEFSMSVGVKLVWIYDELDEEWKIAGGYFVIGGEAEAKKVFYFMTPIGLPLFASFTANLGAEIVLGPEVGGFTGSISPELSLRVAGGVGVEGILSGEVWGKGSLSGEFVLKVHEDPDWSISLGAALGLKAVAFCFEHEWTIWSDSIDFPQTAKLMSLMSANDDTGQWSLKPIDRSYLKNQDVVDGKTKSFMLMGADFEPAENFDLIKSTTPNSDPQIIQFDDKMLAVYLMDPGVESRPEALNSTMAVYTMYRLDENEYIPVDGQEMIALNDDGTADQNPYIFVTDDKVVVTWASATRQFNDADDKDNLLDIAKSYDIQAKFYDRKNETWSLVQQVTDDINFYGEEFQYNDSIARVASFKNPETGNESIMVTYIKSLYPEDTQGDPMASLINATQALCYRTWDGEKWLEEPMSWEDPTTGETVTTVVHEMALTDDYNRAQIPTLDMISYNGVGILTYMQDEDGDEQTTDDQEVYVQYYLFPGRLESNPEGGWTDPIRLTNNDVQDTNPRVGLAGNDISYIFWYSKDRIVYYPLRDLYDYGLERATIEDSNGTEHMIWSVIDGFQPETAILDDTGDEYDSYISGEMKNFEFTVGQDGNVYLLWSENSGTGQEIYMSIFHANKEQFQDENEEDKLPEDYDNYSDGYWSSKYQLTENNAINRNFNGAVTQDGKLWVIYDKVNTNIPDLTDDSQWSNESVFEGKYTDLALTKFEPYSKFEVEIQPLGDYTSDTSKDSNTLIADKSATMDLAVKVNNTGVWEVNNIEITLTATSDKGETLFSKIKLIETPIKGGDYAVVGFTVDNIPNMKLSAAAVKKPDIDVKSLLTLNAASEYDTDELQLTTAPDLKINKKEMLRNSDGTYSFKLIVSNEGTDEAEDCTVNLYLNIPENSASSVVSSSSAGMIGVGEFKEIMISNVKVDKDYFDEFNIASITAEAVYGEEKSFCDMLINNNNLTSLNIRNVFIDREQTEISVGEVEYLDVDIYPAGAESSLKWTSSNTDVVQVSEDSGYIYGVLEGTAEITVTSEIGGYTDTCMVTVVESDNTESHHNHENTGDDNSDSIGTTETSKRNKEIITTVTVSREQFEQFRKSKENSVVTIKDKSDSDSVILSMDLNTLKDMQQSNAVINIEKDEASYTIAALQIDTADILQQFSVQGEHKGKINIEISKAGADLIEEAEKAAEMQGYTIVACPVNFSITYTEDNETYTIDKFNSYVERTIALPDDLDLTGTITGMIVNQDGTLSHVPTKIIEKDNRCYAVLNSLTNSVYTVIKNEVRFTDLLNHWAEKQINDMGSRKIISGAGQNVFEPEREVTRAEFSAIIIRALGVSKSAELNIFSDVKKNDWFYASVNSAYEYGLISGYDDGRFNPNGIITREEAMIIIGRAMKLTGIYEFNIESNEFENFKDKENVSQWAKGEVEACIENEIVKGSNGELNPQNSITRAETVVIIMRLLQNSGLI